MKENKFWMATGNLDKFCEAKEILKEFGINLNLMKVEKEEIQSENLRKIAIHSLKKIELCGRLVMVEDAGIFIDTLRGFPGPFSSYTLDTINLQGILRLLEGVENRLAKFKSVVAYKTKNGIVCFEGEVKGRISHSIRGTCGFGYDPIFIPDEGDGRTFGEMTREEKGAFSHRARAFRSLGKWLSDAK